MTRVTGRLAGGLQPDNCELLDNCELPAATAALRPLATTGLAGPGSDTQVRLKFN